MCTEFQSTSLQLLGDFSKDATAVREHNAALTEVCVCVRACVWHGVGGWQRLGEL